MLNDYIKEVIQVENIDDNQFKPMIRNFSYSTMFDIWHAGKVFALEYPEQSGFTLHSHDYYQVWYVEHGTCEHIVGNKQYLMQGGDIFILPPGINHQTILYKDTRIICCEFILEEIAVGCGTTFYQQIIETAGGISFEMLFRDEMKEASVKHTIGISNQKFVKDQMNKMLEEYTEQNLFFQDYLQLLMLELLLFLLREYALLPRMKVDMESYASYRKLINEAIEYIDQHYYEPLTLSDMYRRFAMSKTYFCYLFKEQTQKTFVEYLTDLRIQHSVELLTQTNLSITEIAETCGFSNSSNFSRSFRKALKSSPSEFRKKVHGTK